MPSLRRNTYRVLTAAFALTGFGALTPLTAEAGSPEPTACPPVQLEQPFVRFGDPSPYTLLPGGSFEDGAKGWALSRARVELGNEPFYVHSPRDKRSLTIQPGGSALSQTTCAGLYEPTLRFFAQSTSAGAVPGGLQVDVLYRDPLGRAQTQQIATVPPQPQWAPTAPITVLANLTAVLPDAQTLVTFRFTGLPGSTWRIDDTYLDPQKRG